MLRHRPSLLVYFTLKTLGFGFLSVKGWFWPPGVLIYREDLVRTRVATTKKRPASASRFSIQWWAVRGSGPPCGRPLRRFAPCALRWQTLARLLSSAPRRVRTRAPATKKRPTGVDRFLFYGGPSGVRARCAGDRCGAFAPCALRWQTLARFLSSAPFRLIGQNVCPDRTSVSIH